MTLIIKNKTELSTTDARRHALDLIEAGISSVLPKNLMRSKVQYDPTTKALIIDDGVIDLSGGRIFVVGGGKAAGRMAEILETIIPPDEITAGVVNCVSGDYHTRSIKIVKAGHPIPDHRGIAGVQQMLSLREEYSINAQDSIICLLSGGGSALLPYPVDGITLEDKQLMTELLLLSGADIVEINTIRKHLSRLKGGHLGRYFSPAKVITLIISDVVGNDLSSIASGPTVNDPTTFHDAFNVISKYGLETKAPESIIAYIKNNIGRNENETTKSLDNCNNYILGDIRVALERMADHAANLGYKPLIIKSEQSGEPGVVAKERAHEILSGKYSDYDVLLLGGETTPVLPETSGKGGRNQHYIAATLLEMTNYTDPWLLASVATDGADFIPEVAGAMVDNDSMSSAKAKGLMIRSFVDSYNSNELLDQLNNSLIKMDYTGTNVGDVILYIL